MSSFIRKGTAALAMVTAGTCALAQTGEFQKVTASDGTAGDLFGTSSAIDGDTIAVGAPGNGTGAAYIFVQTAVKTFVEQAKLTPSDGASGDEFGCSISVWGDTALVGARSHAANGTDAGAAYVFVRSGTTWSQQAKLTPTFAGGPAASDFFGTSVSLVADQCVVGAPGYTSQLAADAGMAFVFDRSGTTWSQQAMALQALDGTTGDEFGAAVSTSFGLTCVGAPQDADLFASGGSAYIFEQIIPGFWSQDAKVTAEFPAAGDEFGSSVAALKTPEVVGVGAPYYDAVAADAGAVFLYVAAPGVDHGWVLGETLLPNQAPGSGGKCGASLAIIASAVVSGAPVDGLSYVWNADDLYSEHQHDATDFTSGDDFGSSTGASGCWWVTGSPNDDDEGADAGAIYIHGLSLPESYCTAGTSANGCSALLSADGAASATATSGFTLQASGAEGAKSGIFFFGDNGQQANSWGSGTSYQCVMTPVVRGGLLTGTGTAGLCDGTFSQDLNALWCATCPKPAKNPGAGTVVQAQLWYRDPQNTSNQTTSLSDAIEFTMCP